MNRRILETRAISFLVSAAMAMPVVLAPVQAFAAENDEQSFEEMPAETTTDETSANEASGDTSASMEEMSEEPAAESEPAEPVESVEAQAAPAADSDTAIQVDLSPVLSSSMKAFSAPWDSNALCAVENQSGAVDVTLDFATLLKDVPEKFEKNLGFWGNAKLWPLQSKFEGKTVNGMPIRLTVKAPAGVSFTEQYTISDKTDTHDFSWADKPGKELLSRADVSFIDKQTAQVDLTIDYIQYQALLDAIADGSIGSWSVSLPTTYSIAQGEDLSAQQIQVSGIAGSPTHMTGFGIALGMDVTMNDSSIPAYTVTPAQLAGIVDDRIPIQSGLTVNDGAQSASLKVGSEFTLAGTLDISEIRNKLEEKIEGYGVGDKLEQVPVHGTGLTMTAFVKLPEQVEWNGDVSTLSLQGKDKDNFAITGAALDGGALNINMSLKDTASIKTLADLVKIMNETQDTMVLDIAGLRAVAPAADPIKVECGVTGVFTSFAVIPESSSKQPGYYQIKYTMVDQSVPSVTLDITETVNMNEEILKLPYTLTVNEKSDALAMKLEEPFTVESKLDMKPVNDALGKELSKVQADPADESISAADTALATNLSYTLPKEIAWSGNKESITLLPAEAAKELTISDAAVKDGVLTVKLALAKPEAITSLKSLHALTGTLSKGVSLKIDGFKTQSETKEPVMIRAELSGSLNSDITIPADHANPQDIQIRYTFDTTEADGPKMTIAPEIEQGKDVYRVYNPNSGEHFYTEDSHEKDVLVKLGWSDEGIGWSAPKESAKPVYRLYNPNASDHHFTMNEKEKDVLVKIGWKYEGIGWYSADQEDARPVWRAYNPNAKEAGAHNFTANEKENLYIISVGWLGEDIGWYALPEDEQAQK